MRRIAVVALKGGQGKTTTVVSLAAFFAGQGRRVLVLDLDTQANASYVLLRGSAPKRPTVSEVLTGDVDLESAIVKSGFPGVDLVPSSADLADVNVAIASEVGRERRLRGAMASLAKAYDVCLIDSGPTRSLLLTNVLNATDEVVVPVVPGVFGFLGLGQIQADINLVRKFLENATLRLSGVVLSCVEKTNVSRDFEASVRESLGELVFAATIPRSIKFEEANGRCLSIFEHAPESPGAEAYAALAAEVWDRGEREEERADAADRDPAIDRREAGEGAGGRRAGRRRAG